MSIAGQTNRGSIASLSWHHCGKIACRPLARNKTNELMGQRRLPAKRDHHANKNRRQKERLQRNRLAEFGQARAVYGAERNTDCSNQDEEQHNLRSEPATIETIPIRIGLLRRHPRTQMVL